MSDRGYAVFLAAMAAVVDLAVTGSAFGMVSFFAEQEAVGAGVSAFVVPVTVFVIGAIVFALLAWAGTRMVRHGLHVSGLRCIVVGLVAGVAYVLAGVVALDPEQGGGVFGFSGMRALSPFTITVAVAAFAIAVGYELVIAGRFRDRAPLEWPWEKRDDE